MSPASDTYIIFGEAKIEDMTSQAQAQAAEQFKTPDAAGADDDDDVPELTEAMDEDADVDADGVEEDEINTVMQQVPNCSRAKAIAALKKHKNIVDAILDLTP